MCGFSGIFSLSKISDAHKRKMHEMTSEIKHRGPDFTDYFSDEFFSVGFNRLSIIDIKGGSQPMISENKKYLICFNGEIYNHKSLRKNLINKGKKFKSSSDTEVFLEYFSNYGMNCIEKMRGMFSVVIYDIENKKIFLIRDRLGIKPLYYSIKEDYIIFSSEISPLYKSNLIKIEPNYQAISSYLSFRYNYGVGGYIRSINTLKPGNFFEFSLNSKSEKEYWTIPTFLRIDQQKLDEEKIIEKLDKILNESIEDHIVSDVPVGSLLSGGLDSSIITTLMKDKVKGDFNSFSAKFDETGYDESNYAKQIANKIGITHHDLELKADEYEKKIINYINLKKTPLSIPHEIALFSLFEKIKKKTKVVLSGEGADEIFGGYGRVQSSAFDYKKKNILNSIFSNDRSKNISQFFIDRYNWMSFGQKEKIFSKDFYTSINKDEKIKKFWSNEFRKIKNLDPYDQFLIIFQKFHLTCLLDRLDYTSMASGVEARTPFVDHKVIEFANSIPYEFKFVWKSKLQKLIGLFSNSLKNSEHRDISKYILRKTAEKYIPKNIVYRKKLGFPVPLDNWIKKGMIKFAKEILIDNKTKSRGIFNITEIEKILSSKELLEYDFWGKKIWMILNLEIWFRKVIDK